MPVVARRGDRQRQRRGPALRACGRRAACVCGGGGAGTARVQRVEERGVGRDQLAGGGGRGVRGGGVGGRALEGGGARVEKEKEGGDE